jgi:DNA-directed RNA polymerase specialized sigma24 family protein
MASTGGNPADRKLVEQCLRGDEQAWKKLVAAHHGKLLESIHRLRVPRPRDSELAEEIADRVWNALSWKDFALLHLFEARKGNIDSFLAALARHELQHYGRKIQREREIRSEWARHHPQVIGGEEAEWPLILAEFANTLSPKEKTAFLMLLGKIPNTGQFSAGYWRVLTGRIKKKWDQFFHRD